MYHLKKEMYGKCRNTAMFVGFINHKYNRLDHSNNAG